MRIGILGQPCLDLIIYPSANREIPKPVLGGVLYSFAAMERLMRERRSQDTFVPLMFVSNPDRDALTTLLSKFNHKEGTVGLWPTDSLTNRVELRYQDDGHRLEYCSHILPPLTARELSIELLESLDALSVNMISGFDVSIDVLEQGLSRASKRPFVHLDVHALTLGSLSGSDKESLAGGGREPHGVAEWRRWLALADSVQMNEFEARWFADPQISSENDLLGVIGQMDGNVRPEYVLITRGARGASVYDFGSGEENHIPAPKGNAIETTGSGDVFGSVFTFSIVAGRRPEDATREAVNWATWNTTLSSLEHILDAPLFHN